MRSIYAMIMMAMVCLSMTIEKTMIHGTVTDASGELLIGVNVVVKETKIGTTTDMDGKFALEVRSGIVELELSYTGYSNKIIRVEIKEGEKKEVNVVLEEAVVLDEVVVVGYAVEKSRKRAASKVSTSSAIVTDDDVAFSRTDMVMAPPSTTKGTSERLLRGKVAGVTASRSSMEHATSTSIGTADHVFLTDEEMPEMELKDFKTKVLHFKTDASTMVLDGKVVSKNLIPMAKLNPLEVIVLENKLKAEQLKKRKEKKDPKAGQLTAGEWNDLNNWKDWEKLKKDKEFEMAMEDWEMNMFDRYAVLVENENGLPLADAFVQLLNEKKEVVWKARTDNFGTAELYANVFRLNGGQVEENNKNGKFQIVGVYQGERFSIKKAKRYTEKGLAPGKINKVKISRECNVTDQLDIMMVVDATGSMKDEIAYLKSELKDVIRRVQNADDDLYIRLGSVFYRDHGDAYLTKQTPLSEDIQQTVDFINQQNAKGGGDTPEAVDEALMEAIEKQDWSEEAVARIVFLVLDAPPHSQETHLISLKKTIQQAATKGIKIIPITASGINKSTEYLMKFMATATNSTYVFITDDSGIGNSHLKPTASKYDIELLNDLMVRLITKYTDRSKCETQEEQLLVFQNDPSNQTSMVVFPLENKLLSKVKYFPNPAISNLTIQLQDDFSEITIVNSSGQEVLRLEKLQAGQRAIDVSNLSEGFYLIRFKKDKTVASGKLVIIRP